MAATGPCSSILTKRHVSIHGTYRSDFLIISFNPDQMSSTAQTLISTNPRGRASFRTTSSVRSVSTLEDFFG